MEIVSISLLIFLVAALYSSVGHGGASGYLAVMAIFSFAPKAMASTALVLNIVVSSIAFYNFSRAGHFDRRLILPILITSVPAAFIGGYLKLTDHTYEIILGITLLVVAAIMILYRKPSEEIPTDRVPSKFITSPIGLVVGLVSGMIGIGGGIFLSPILVLARWATVKRAAATAATFIFFNSLAGLAGRWINSQLEFVSLAPFFVAALLGGITGSFFGATKISNRILKTLLSLVLVFASYKLLIK